MNLIETLASGCVRRYHTSPIAAQPLSSHQWGVATIIMAMYNPVMPSPALMVAALYHDAGEYVTGDVPHPAKREDPMLGNMVDSIERRTTIRMIGHDFRDDLSVREREHLNFADTMELVWYCLEQYRTAGNRHAKLMAERAMNRYRTIHAEGHLDPTCYKVLKALIAHQSEL